MSWGTDSHRAHPSCGWEEALDQKRKRVGLNISQPAVDMTLVAPRLQDDAALHIGFHLQPLHDPYHLPLPIVPLHQAPVSINDLGNVLEELRHRIGIEEPIPFTM